MKNGKKIIFGLFLLITMLIFAVSVYANEPDGKIKNEKAVQNKIKIEKYDTSKATHNGVYNGIEWFTFSDGLLYMRGDATGPLTDEYGLQPWESFRPAITQVYCDYNPGKNSCDNVFNGLNKVYNIEFGEHFDTSRVTDMYSMFYGCATLKSLDLRSFNTSQVTDMSFMFYDCDSLEQINISSFDTSKVKDMSFMFFECKKLRKIDVAGFSTKNVKDMNHMFYSCQSLESLNVREWNTVKVKDMNGMFGFCEKMTILDAKRWSTVNVADMNHMFDFCSSLEALNLENFDMTSVNDVSDMLEGCYVLGIIKTPRRTRLPIVLPHTFYDNTGEEYDEIPENARNSVTLKVQGYIGDAFNVTTKAEKKRKKILDDILETDEEKEADKKKPDAEKVRLGKIEKAIKKGYGAIGDTVAVVYENQKATVNIDPGTIDNIITVVKGSRISIVDNDEIGGSYLSENSHIVSVSPQGVLRAKAVTDEEGVCIEYSASTVEKTLTVYVVEPKALEYVSGYEHSPAATTGLTQVISAKKAGKGTFISAEYEVPLNATLSETKTFMKDFTAMLSVDDGKLHISGIVSTSGIVTVPFNVNGKQYKARLILLPL